MAKMKRVIPFVGWTWQRILSVFLMIAIVIAVVWRVPQMRKFVTGS